MYGFPYDPLALCVYPFKAKCPTKGKSILAGNRIIPQKEQRHALKEQPAEEYVMPDTLAVVLYFNAHFSVTLYIQTYLYIYMEIDWHPASMQVFLGALALPRHRGTLWGLRLPNPLSLGR